MTEILEQQSEVSRLDPKSRDRAPGLLDKHFLHRGYGVEFEMECDWVRHHLPREAKRVVDVGCGIGGLFETIGTDRVWGVDHLVEGLQITRERFATVRLLGADALHLPFPDATFDAMTVQHVVEHIGAYQDACAEWSRVLRPGGVLLMLTPNAAFEDPAVYDDETHVHIFNHQELGETVRGAGLEIIDLRTIGLPWFRYYHSVRSGWRFRQFVTRRARTLSALPRWRWKGQTLCCAARRVLNG